MPNDKFNQVDELIKQFKITVGPDKLSALFATILKILDEIKNENPQKPDSVVYEKLGLIYCLNKQYLAAIVACTIALTLDPNTINCRFYRGYAYYSRNQFFESSIDFNRFLNERERIYRSHTQVNPNLNEDDAKTTIIKLKSIIKSIDESEIPTLPNCNQQTPNIQRNVHNFYQKILEQNISLTYQIYKNIGQIYFNLEDFSAAISHFKTASRMISTVDATLNNTLAFAYLEAREANPLKQRGYVRRAQILFFSNPEGCSYMSSMYAEERNFEKALACFSQGLIKFPNNEQLIKDRDILINETLTRFDGLLSKLKSKEASGDLDGVALKEAEKSLLEILQSQKNNVKANYLLAKCHYLSKQLDETIQQCNMALELDPTNIELYEFRAFSLLELNRVKEAMTDYEVLTSSKNPDVGYFINFAFCYERLQLHDESLKILDKAENFFGKNNFLIIYAKAQIYYSVKKYNKAHEWYKKSLGVLPSNQQNQFSVYKYLCFCCNFLEKYLEGISFGEMALALKETDANLHHNIGVAYYHADRKIEAEKHFMRTLQLNPQHANAYLSLGNCYLDQHNLDAARTVWEKGINQATQESDQILLRQSLDRLKSRHATTFGRTRVS